MLLSCSLGPKKKHLVFFCFVLFLVEGSLCIGKHTHKHLQILFLRLNIVQLQSKTSKGLIATTTKQDPCRLWSLNP